MVYNKWSIIGLMLWFRYALLKGKIFMSLSQVYAEYLESPGTKAYTAREARIMFSSFKDVHISTVLTHGDLLESDAGQRHRGLALSVAKKIWPRQFIRKFFPEAGLFMMIEARK